MDFRTVDLVSLARSVRTKEVSARELVAAALARIDDVDRSINAFVAVDGERALDQAAAVDQIVMAGADPGSLAGVPIGVKDAEDVAGYRTTYGSVLFADSAAAHHDSVLVARLRAAGAVVVGKTNLPELAWTSHTHNSLFGTTRNPWTLDRSAGGSSGGSAAAVAAGMVPLATASDGGGSIRIPAACCGLVGVKPSLGRVPADGRHGAGWLGLTSKGVLARRVADVVTALAPVVGPEPTDLNSLPRPDADWHGALVDAHVPARVAWCPGLGYSDVDADVLSVAEQVVSALDDLGAEVVEIGAVFDRDPLDDWLVIAGACLFRTLAPHRDRWDEVTAALVSLVERAAALPPIRIVEAFDRCYEMNAALVDLFRDVQLLVCATTAGLAPPISLGGRGTVNGVEDPNWVRFTYPFNMTRSPAATLCAGLSAQGVPVGVQLIGPQHADLAVLRAAAALEAAIGFDAVAPLAGA